jgi:hypothetical protein
MGLVAARIDESDGFVIMGLVLMIVKKPWWLN